LVVVAVMAVVVVVARMIFSSVSHRRNKLHGQNTRVAVVIKVKQPTLL